VLEIIPLSGKVGAKLNLRNFACNEKRLALVVRGEMSSQLIEIHPNF